MKLIVEKIEEETNWDWGVTTREKVGRTEKEISLDDLIVKNNEIYGILYEDVAVLWQPGRSFECSGVNLSGNSIRDTDLLECVTIRHR